MPGAFRPDSPRVVAAVATAIVTLGALPSSGLADTGTIPGEGGMVVAIASFVLIPVNVGLSASVGRDLSRPVPNASVARLGVGVGAVGIVDGAVSMTLGLVDWRRDHGGLVISAISLGAITLAAGAFAFGFGLGDVVRGDRTAAAVPRPVLLSDRREGMAPGLAWSGRF